MEIEKERIIYLDILRVAATMAVVMIHLTSVAINDYQVRGVQWLFSEVLNGMLRWAVPVFFMISGALFLRTEKEIEYKKFFRKNVFRIISCIFFWGLFYSVLDIYLYSKVSIKSIFIVLYNIISGNAGYHLWFLYTLLMIYIFLPIIKRYICLDKSKSIKYLLGVWIIFGVCINYLNNIGNMVLNIERIIEVSLSEMFIYIGYFIFGHYLNSIEIKKKVRKMIIFLSCISCIVFSLLNIFVSYYLNKSVGVFTEPTGIATCMTCCGIFIYCKTHTWKNISNNLRKIICTLSDKSFGIYLVHVFWIYFFFRIFKLEFRIEWVLLYFILIFGVSVVTTHIGSKIPIIKRIF